MSDRAILHIDMNNFYASVECMMNPDLKPHPIAVCGSQEDRHGIVLAKNYKAKAFGVSTGEAIWQVCVHWRCNKSSHGNSDRKRP